MRIVKKVKWDPQEELRLLYEDKSLKQRQTW